MNLFSGGEALLHENGFLLPYALCWLRRRCGAPPGVLAARLALDFLLRLDLLDRVRVRSRRHEAMIDLAGRIDDALLARIERMARRADVDLEFSVVEPTVKVLPHAQLTALAG